MLKWFLRKQALEKGRYVLLWRRLYQPGAEEWSIYLRRHAGFYRFGEASYILPESVITDPSYTSIGNNVIIAGAWLSGHDGSVFMLNQAYGRKLDAVGPITIHDDVFIGRGATILPGVRIGPRAIIGAGSVIARDVPPNSVVAGNPAKVIRSLDEHVEHIQARTDSYPWKELISSRERGFDPAMEPELKAQRIAYFFGDNRN